MYRARASKRQLSHLRRGLCLRLMSCTTVLIVTFPSLSSQPATTQLPTWLWLANCPIVIDRGSNAYRYLRALTGLTPAWRSLSPSVFCRTLLIAISNTGCSSLSYSLSSVEFLWLSLTVRCLATQVHVACLLESAYSLCAVSLLLDSWSPQQCSSIKGRLRLVTYRYVIGVYKSQLMTIILYLTGGGLSMFDLIVHPGTWDTHVRDRLHCLLAGIPAGSVGSRSLRSTIWSRSLSQPASVFPSPGDLGWDFECLIV